MPFLQTFANCEMNCKLLQTKILAAFGFLS